MSVVPKLIKDKNVYNYRCQKMTLGKKLNTCCICILYMLCYFLYYIYIGSHPPPPPKKKKYYF